MLEAGGSIYLTQRLLCRCQFLSSRPTTRNPAERETECEWRDPENACTTGLIQGVSTRTLSPKCAGKVGTQRGENASYRHGGGRRRDFSTTPSVSRSAGSFGLRSK